MVLHKSFRDDLVEHIKDSYPGTFKECGKTRVTVLADKDLIDRLWAVYQKNIEDYDMEAPEAYRDALENVMGIHAII